MSKNAVSADPKVYGWCPGALRPMMSGDGLVVRIRAPLGRLSPPQAREVAKLSQSCGNGLIDLSARGNLQLRGIREDRYETLIAALGELGLVDADPDAEARRNILLTPFWAEDDDTHAVATDLNRSLTLVSDLILPGKFGFAVDCGPAPLLCGSAADIRIEQGKEGLILRADGAETGLSITRNSAAEEAIALARWFLDQGGAPEGRGRMQTLIARRGPPVSHVATRAISAEQPSLGPCATGQLIALEFGQIPSDSFAALAGYGALRLTPWRMLLVEGAPDIAPHPRLILDATDPRLQVVACTGAPGCLQAHAATRDLARHLAPHVPTGAQLHVSGCSKGCAQPTPADLVLTASGPETFDLIHHGKASDQPLRETLSAAALRANPAILTEGS